MVQKGNTEYGKSLHGCVSVYPPELCSGSCRLRLNRVRLNNGRSRQCCAGRHSPTAHHHGARAARAFFFGAALEPGLRFTSHGIKGAEGFCFP